MLVMEQMEVMEPLAEKAIILLEVVVDLVTVMDQLTLLELNLVVVTERQELV